MRLRITKELLKEALTLMHLNVEDRNSTPRTYKLHNANSLRKAISLISKTGLFNESINILKNMEFYSSGLDVFIVTEQEFRILQHHFPFLMEQTNAIVNAIANIISEDNANVISIKIPDPITFNDISETTQSLDKIFNQTLLHKDITGNFRIVNFDSGSYWIDILIEGGVSVFHLVAALAWGSAVVYKKIQEGKLLSEQVRALKLSNDATEEINQKRKKATNEIAKQEAEFIYKSFYKGNDPEQIERIKLALNELAFLYSKGAEVHPNIEAPKEVKEEFPNMKQLEKVKSRIKELPAST